MKLKFFILFLFVIQVFAQNNVCQISDKELGIQNYEPMVVELFKDNYINTKNISYKKVSGSENYYWHYSFSDSCVVSIVSQTELSFWKICSIKDSNSLKNAFVEELFYLQKINAFNKTEDQTDSIAKHIIYVMENTLNVTTDLSLMIYNYDSFGYQTAEEKIDIDDIDLATRADLILKKPNTFLDSIKLCNISDDLSGLNKEKKRPSISIVKLTEKNFLISGIINSNIELYTFDGRLIKSISPRNFHILEIEKSPILLRIGRINFILK